MANEWFENKKFDSIIINVFHYYHLLSLIHEPKNISQKYDATRLDDVAVLGWQKREKKEQIAKIISQFKHRIVWILIFTTRERGKKKKNTDQNYYSWNNSGNENKSQRNNKARICFLFSRQEAISDDST